MKKTLIVSIIAILGLIFLFWIITPSTVGYFIYEEKLDKEILGYCPTMQEEALYLSEENNYELINLGSASEVLSALKNERIDKALIGRKAELAEINENTKETILKSGYTLVSNKKEFVSDSQLSFLKIYSYLKIDNLNFEIINISKEEISKKINEGKIVLISWDDWQDSFELIVVMNENEKVKEFRGVFLYEN